MKKLITALLALMLIASLAACGGKDNTSSTDEGNKPAITTVNAGKLTMTTSPDFPPYENLDDNGNVVGIDIEIMQKIAEKLNLELQIDTMEFDAALLAVQTGKCDVAASGITVNDDRKLVMNFTDPYTTAVQVVVLPEDSDVTLDNLGEKKIGTQRGTTGYLYTVDDFGEDHVVAYDTYTTVIQALLNKQIDCVVMDDAVAKAYVAANPGLKILDTAYAEEEYAFAVNKDNAALTEAANNALKELIADGTVKSIIDKWINK
ncbi:MAG: transporter substrate-binding domain-containing protein [Clostridia bacterium]|nr:transporter substrate-binding domain-containing protein [Clostridia bacterium]